MNLINQPAVPFTLQDATGKMHRLSDYSGFWLLMVFHRHLGWLPCRGHLSQLRERKDEFLTKDIKVAVVTFEAAFLARQYIEETVIEWPLLVDANRDIYRAYGMLDAGFWDIWGPSTWLGLSQGDPPRPTAEKIVGWYPAGNGTAMCWSIRKELCGYIMLDSVRQTGLGLMLFCRPYPDLSYRPALDYYPPETAAVCATIFCWRRMLFIYFTFLMICNPGLLKSKLNPNSTSSKRYPLPILALESYKMTWDVPEIRNKTMVKPIH